MVSIRFDNDRMLSVRRAHGRHLVRASEEAGRGNQSSNRVGSARALDGSPVRIFPTVYLTVLTVLSAIVLSQLILSPTPVLSSIFTNPLLQHLGRISYGLYLWQQLFASNPNAHWGALQMFPINVIVALAIAESSYWLVEVRFLNLKDRISDRIPSIRSAAASPWSGHQQNQ